MVGWEPQIRISFWSFNLKPSQNQGTLHQKKGTTKIAKLRSLFSISVAGLRGKVDAKKLSQRAIQAKKGQKHKETREDPKKDPPLRLEKRHPPTPHPPSDRREPPGAGGSRGQLPPQLAAAAFCGQTAPRICDPFGVARRGVVRPAAQSPEDSRIELGEISGPR